jgi:hypothetical protein
MKEIKFSLFCLIASSLSVSANETSTINAKGKRTPKEVWISTDRTDGKGHGTQLDPFDGGTRAKFDSIMTDRTKVTTNTKVHLGPGLFMCSPTALPKGIQLSGAGKMITEVRLDPLAQPSIQIHEAGDIGDRMSNWVLKGTNATNTDKANNGILYWKIVGKIVSLYKDPAGTSLVARGAVSGAAATLAEQNHSGISGSVAVTGSGDETSISRQTLTLGYAANVLYQPYNLDGADSLVADLTVNCNYEAFKKRYGTTLITLNAVHLTGNRSAIRNVHAVGGNGDWDTRSECFQLVVGTWHDGTAWQPIYDAVIEGCLVESPGTALPYGSAIDLFVADNSETDMTKRMGGIARNNTVNNWKSGSAFGGVGANLTFVNNTANDISCFWYGDSGYIDHLVVRHNSVRGLGYGPNNSKSTPVTSGKHFVFANFQKAAAVNNVRVEDNDIVANGTTGGYVSALVNCSGSWWTVRDNHVSTDSRSDPAASFIGWELNAVNHITLEGNTFDRPYDCRPGRATNVVQTEASNAGGSNSLIGALRTKATVISMGGFFGWNIAGSFTVATEDHLLFETYADENNPLCWPMLLLIGSNGGYSTLIDQNGASTGGRDISVFARGRWYSRDCDLSRFAGQSVRAVQIGGTAQQDQPPYGYAPKGTYINYYQNIRVVDSKGNIKVRYYTPQTKGVISSATNNNVSDLSIIPNFQGR